MDDDNLKFLDQYNEINFEEMEREFGNFYAPSFYITINDVDILSKGIEVNSVSVNNSITAANTCSVSISNVYNPVERDVRWIHKEIELGSPIKIYMGYGKSLKLMFLGVVTALKIGFQSGSLPNLEVTGQDYSHYMMKGIKSRTYGSPNALCSQVVKEIVSGYNKYLTVEGVQDLGDQFRLDDELKQETISDYTFITNIAKKYFLEFFVSGNIVYFRRPPDKNSRIITLEYGRNMTNFSTETNITEQITRVEIRAWDEKTKQAIKKTVDLEVLNEPNSQKKKDLLEKSYGKTATVVIHTPVKSEYEAGQLALSLLKGQLQKMVKGTAETVGIPAILAGRNINLIGLGSTFSKLYYITGSTHTINTSGYKTSFQVEESV